MTASMNRPYLALDPGQLLLSQLMAAAHSAVARFSSRWYSAMNSFTRSGCMSWVLRPLRTLALDHLAAHGESISASPAVVGVGAAIVLLACRRTIRKCGISRDFGNWYSVRILFSQPTSLLELVFTGAVRERPAISRVTAVELGRRN